jgi:hypothetical protein
MVQLQYEIPRIAARRSTPARLIGGLGGLVFGTSVIAQNLIRASGMPPNDASADKVIDFYADGRGATVALAILFPIGAAGLIAFVSSLVARTSGASRVPAVAGALGAAAIFAGYAMTLATDVGLAGYVHRGTPDPEIVSALWILHNAVFGVLMMGIAIALVGLSVAAVDAGILGRVWKRIGVAGALALAVGAASTPAAIDGSPLLVVGVLGFLTWVAFVVRTSTALLKRSAS